MSKSLAEQVAALSEEDREEVLAELDPDQLLYDWEFWGRPEQHLPDHDRWSILLALAGRGFGKTRMAAEAVRTWAREPNIRIGLVARTSADARDIIVEGESGILAVCPPSERPEYFPSKRRLVWPNGSQATVHTADEPNTLRGVQYHRSFADEFAAWRQIPDEVGMTAWENLRIATRLPDHGKPRILIATTPKKVPALRSLLKEAETDETIIVRRGATSDNSANLDPSYIKAMYGVYEGTRISRQELYGEMLDDIDGALWTEEVIETTRQLAFPEYAKAPLRVVGVDPTVAEKPGDECGIVVACASFERDLYKRHAWVLEDATVQGNPETWAKQVVKTARKWGAPVVAEKNQGGALIRNAINQIDPGIPVYDVWSMHGKQLRAEPVSLIYEQERVHHYGTFPELELQMTTWEPGAKGTKSPDRVDALVHALTALLILPPKGFGGGPIRAKSLAGRTIPLGKGFNSRGSGAGTGRRAARGGRVILPR